MRRYLYIINPASGTGPKNLLQQTITSFAEKENLHYEIVASVASGDYSFLHAFIKERGITDVVIAGGDGTVNAAIDNLRHLDVQFGILPCGSGNGLAFSAGIPKNIYRALEIILKGKGQWTDALLINDRFACMLCGVGFDAQVAYEFANDPKRGLATYVRKSVQHFFKAKSYPFALYFEDVHLELDAFLISIANSNQFGNNFIIAPGASLTDGLLDVVIITKQHKLNLLLQMAKHMAGYNRIQQVNLLNKKESIIHFQTEGIKIINKEMAPLHIDGDPASTAAIFNVQLLKACFRLVFP